MDLTQLMARERGLHVEEEEFNSLMDEQKKKAKESGKFMNDSNEVQWIQVSDGTESEFVGYSTHISFQD